MYNVLLSFHVLICVLVVVIVLVQSGKGAGISGLFGGGGGDAGGGGGETDGGGGGAIAPFGATSIAAGRYHSLVVRNDGTLWAWGGNTYDPAC